MPRKKPRRLAACHVALAKRAYEAGATFSELAGRYGVSEVQMRRRLHEAGAVARRRGTRSIKLPAAELVVADHRAGMSARAIAEKHGIKDHHQVTALLRSHGLTPHHRGRSRGNRAVTLGKRVVNVQGHVRRRYPPLVVPVRTDIERVGRAWTAPEREAVSLELRAGRYRVVPRGASGVRHRSLYEALHPAQFAQPPAPAEPEPVRVETRRERRARHRAQLREAA